MRGERHRLVWRSQAATGLILADLCPRCATNAERLIDRYGGHQPDAVALVNEAWRQAPLHRVLGASARVAVYVLIAITFFLIVTSFSSLTH